MTLDEAIELLEITEDIDAISEKELKEKRKRAMQRWHPDKVPDHLKEHYTETFQKIEIAVNLIFAYRTGNAYAGQEFTAEKEGSRSQQQEEKMRTEVPGWKAGINAVWDKIKSLNWQMTQRANVISDGFKLKDVLDRDVKDDVMAVSVSAFFMGIYAFMAFSIICIFLPFLFFILVPALLIHSLLCFVYMLPLSRIWMPNWLNDATFYAVKLGLNIGDFIMKNLGHKRIFRVLVNWPFYFTKGMTLLIVMPIYKMIGYFLRDKVVGVKIRQERYLSDFPEHYIDQLLQKDVHQMSWLELRHLSEIHHICTKFN